MMNKKERILAKKKKYYKKNRVHILLMKNKLLQERLKFPVFNKKYHKKARVSFKRYLSKKNNHKKHKIRALKRAKVIQIFIENHKDEFNNLMKIYEVKNNGRI